MTRNQPSGNYSTSLLMAVIAFLLSICWMFYNMLHNMQFTVTR